MLHWFLTRVPDNSKDKDSFSITGKNEVGPLPHIIQTTNITDHWPKRAKTVTGVNLCNPEWGNDFLAVTLKP